jgi:hypothetical protein
MYLEATRGPEGGHTPSEGESRLQAIGFSGRQMRRELTGSEFFLQKREFAPCRG